MIEYSYRVFLKNSEKPFGAGRLRARSLDDALRRISEEHPVSKLHPFKYEHLRKIAIKRNGKFIGLYQGGVGERGGYWYRSSDLKCI